MKIAFKILIGSFAVVGITIASYLWLHHSNAIPSKISNLNKEATTEASQKINPEKIRVASKNSEQKPAEWIPLNAANVATEISHALAAQTKANENLDAETPLQEAESKTEEITTNALTFYAVLMAAKAPKILPNKKRKAAVQTSYAPATEAKQSINISLFPNPTTNSISIDFPKDFTEDYGVFIIDHRGVVQAFYEKRGYGNKQLKLNVSELTAGKYYLRIFSQKHTSVTSFIKS